MNDQEREDGQRAAEFFDRYVTKRGGKVGGWDALKKEFAAVRAAERDAHRADVEAGEREWCNAARARARRAALPRLTP